jgi:hypothetical protein
VLGSVANALVPFGNKTVLNGGAMAPTTTFVSVEEYPRNSSFEPDAEYADGQIEERAVGEFDHSIWQKAIVV